MHISDPVHAHFRLARTQAAALQKLRIATVRDLLFHFPNRYGDYVAPKRISELVAGERATVHGRIAKIEKTRGFQRKIPMTKAVLEDISGTLRVAWFHQPYIAEMLREGMLVQLTGKITAGKQGLYLANPESDARASYALSSEASLLGGTDEPDTTPLVPSYSESRGITSRWFFYALKRVLASGAHTALSEYLPEEILKKYNLPSLKTALVWIHRPRESADAEAARKRFAFEEVFFIQLALKQSRTLYQSNTTFPVSGAEKSVKDFTERFGFPLTSAQNRAIACILEDMKEAKPMSRLLEGDVGSGKTAVAATVAYSVATSRPSTQDSRPAKRGQSFGRAGNLQTAIMAPTEILAKQHFDSFMNYFADLSIPIGLITGSVCKKFPSKVHPREATAISRSQLLKWVKNGEIPLLIGTHSLIQKSVAFKHLACVIIDEQHRFGTMQRFKLARKEEKAPHLLSMTATPIPRTLALTIYGDLDLTLLDEMPPGRKTVITRAAYGSNRTSAYEVAREELEKGRQAYVICPRIDEPDLTKRLALIAKSVKQEAERLKREIFPGYRIEILHGKITPQEREEIMERFEAKKIDILVATSVIEVGVNVPNATVILIEGADRFGLAQLHQLRGRVLRSTHQAYCFLFSDNSKGGASSKRISALEKASSGFALAELDLKMRGAGELSGRKQWGISDLGMEAIKNIKMVEAARTEATRLIAEDPELKNHPLLAERVESADKIAHLE